MRIVCGAYHLRPKPVAFRDDYCFSCRAPRRSIAVRSFDVGHIFWVPFLPVGVWRHWICSVCGRKPHSRSRRLFRWTGLYSLIGVAVLFWAVPVGEEFAVGSWICRMAAPAGAIFLFMRLMRGAKPFSLRNKLASIPPTADIVCPFCSVPLVAGTGDRWSCPACNAVRY
jgi:hypothetical protein